MTTFAQIIEGMTILLKYNSPDTYINGADHDIIFFAYTDPEGMDPQDVNRLKELYFFYEDGSWRHFV